MFRRLVVSDRGLDAPYVRRNSVDVDNVVAFTNLNSALAALGHPSASRRARYVVDAQP
jgi:hypothetical protein